MGAFSGGGEFTYTLSTNSATPHIPDLARAVGWDGVSRLTVNITAALTNSLRVEAAWAFPGGLVINIGAGSRVGGVRGFPDGNQGSTGGRGGAALYVRQNCTINNLGTLSGGGGGGGNGQAVRYGGSAAALGGLGGYGQGFVDSSSLVVTAATSGEAGTSNGDGFGHTVTGGTGGNGGAWGIAGGTGTLGSGDSPRTEVYPNTIGGLSGFAVDGNSFITWQNTGTRLGDIV